MPQALIKVNAVVGSNTDLPINVLVALDNQNTGGELTYRWAMLDEPPGALDALSSLVIQAPTFTPKKEGTYLLELVVNEFLPTEARDRVVCAVRQVKTNFRVPAAGEDTEADASDGWATSVDVMLRAFDAVRADPGLFIAKVEGTPIPSLVRGNLVRFSTSELLLSGLPGEQRIGRVRRDTALNQTIYRNLGIIEGSPFGGVAWGDGAFVFARREGLVRDVPVVGIPPVGFPVYVDDLGTLSKQPGTNWRRVGTVAAQLTPPNFDIVMDNLGPDDGQNRAVIFATVAADQNNYAPTGVEQASTLVLTPTVATRTITGLANVDGVLNHGPWRKTIINASTTQGLVLSHEDVLSLAAQRFLCPSAISFTLAPLGAVEIEYDRTAARWRVLATTASVAFGVPVDVGQLNAAGVSVSSARADHVHNHAAQPLNAAASLHHAAATTVLNGFMSAADKTKLDGISPNPLTLIGAYGANMAGADVGKHLEAQSTSGGAKAAALSSDNSIEAPFDGTIRKLAWSSVAADATTQLKINIAGVVASTHLLTGTAGVLTIAVAVLAGELVAVEFDAGTGPGRTTVQLYAARTP